jgi:hypothetical protein
MGFKGGFAAFTDGFMRSQEATANRARLDAQDKRVEESFAMQKKEAERVSRDRDEADRIDKLERDTRSTLMNPPVATQTTPPTSDPALQPQQSSEFKSDGPSLTSPSLSDVINKASRAPVGLSGYGLERAVADTVAKDAGGFKRAREISARARTLRQEGATDALDHLENNDPESALKSFDGIGDHRMPEGARFVKNGTSEDPLTGAVKDNWQVVGSDGKVINGDVRKSMYAFAFGRPEMLKMEASKHSGDAKAQHYKEQLEQQRWNSIANGRGGSGASGGSSAKGGKVAGEFDGVDSALDSAFKASDKTYSTQQVASIGETAQRIKKFGHSLSDAQSANLAMRIQDNPALEVPDIDIKTGKISMVVRSPVDGDLITRSGFASALKPMGLTGAQLGELAVAVKSNTPPQDFEALRDVAFDPSGQAARRYMTAQTNKIRDQVLADPRTKNIDPTTLAQFLHQAVANDVEPSMLRLATLIKNKPEFKLGVDGKPLVFDESGMRVQPRKNMRDKRSTGLGNSFESPEDIQSGHTFN